MTVLPDGVITYDSVAGGLRPEVRESIETSLPCFRSADRRHIWSRENALVMCDRSTMPMRVDIWWQCFYCGVCSRTDPRPVDDRSRRHVSDLPTLDEIYRLL